MKGSEWRLALVPEGVNDGVNGRRAATRAGVT